jgi:hypothetical protein
MPQIPNTGIKEEGVVGLPEVAVDVVGMVHEDVLVDALGFVVQTERLIHPGQVIPTVNKTPTVSHPSTQSSKKKTTCN